jgi:hypothetical protein
MHHPSTNPETRKVPIEKPKISLNTNKPRSIRSVLVCRTTTTITSFIGNASAV